MNERELHSYLLFLFRFFMRSGITHVFFPSRFFRGSDVSSLLTRERFFSVCDVRYGLSWNPVQEGHLLSGAEDRTICLWDVLQATKANNVLEPRAIFKGHEDVVGVRHQNAVFSSHADWGGFSFLPDG